jgi:glycine cleavage system regulatory protein
MVAANKSLAIISIMGRDQKGVVARVSTCLAGGNIDIEDIKARDRHYGGEGARLGCATVFQRPAGS